VNTPYHFIFKFSYYGASFEFPPDDIGRDPAGRQHHSTPASVAGCNRPGRGLSLPITPADQNRGGIHIVVAKVTLK
jgi:hypothetical protein